MAIRITCPGCQASLTLQDEMRGRKVRCKKCEQVINIPAATGVKKKEAEAVQAGRNVKMKAVPERADDDEEQEEETPKKKKKKKSKKGAPPLLLIGGLAGIFLLVVAGGISAYYLFGVSGAPRPPEKVFANAPDEKDNRTPARIVVPSIKEGNPANQKKGGTGIVGNIRGAAYRAERRSELKQIGLSFVQYADEYKGTNRNLETWLEYIKTYGPIRDSVKEGYYKMNFNARMEGSSVIAYERDIDNGQAHLCVKGDGSVDHVPLAELKTILGRDP